MNAPKCNQNCQLCRGGHESNEGLPGWVAAGAASAATAPAGWSLLWRAGLAFVLPVLLAVVGAVLAGTGETARIGGATGGLLAGGLLAAGVMRLLGRAQSKAPDAKESR